MPADNTFYDSAATAWESTPPGARASTHSTAETTSKIAALADLKEDWDSYGAAAIAPAAVAAAQNFVATRLKGTPVPPPAVVPTSAGGVQLEWHGAGADLEIEFPAAGETLVWFEDQRTGREEEFPIGSDPSALGPLLERIQGAD